MKIKGTGPGNIEDRRSTRKNTNGRVWKPVKRTMFITGGEPLERIETKFRKSRDEKYK